MNIVEEFWILNFDGITLFHYSPEEDKNYQLISAFFSAIQSFANELLDKSQQDRHVHQISLGKSNFTFLVNQDYQLYFVSKSSLEIKEKQVKKHLKNIEEMFLEDFKSFSFKGGGEISKYEVFNEKFSIYFNNNFIKLKGMW